MSRNTKISILCPTAPMLPVKIGDYAAYEKEMIKILKSNIDNVLPDKPDLIILPECCNRFNKKSYPSSIAYRSDVKEYYKYLEDRMVSYMGEIAKNNNTNIAYSAVRYVPEDEKYHYRNSTVYIGRDASIKGIYDKNHLVVEENSIGNVGYGTKSDLIELDFGKVASAICFDLNFDMLLDKYKVQDPDLIVFCSAYHGGLRQEQWAYECRSYFAGAIGEAPGRILNPYGQVVAQTTNYTNFVTATVNLDYELCHIDYNMDKINVAKRKYKDALTVYDPGFVGSLMLSCESPDMNVQDIIDEFEIERLNDYIKRALKHREENL